MPKHQGQLREIPPDLGFHRRVYTCPGYNSELVANQGLHLSPISRLMSEQQVSPPGASPHGARCADLGCPTSAAISLHWLGERPTSLIVKLLLQRNLVVNDTSVLRARPISSWMGYRDSDFVETCRAVRTGHSFPAFWPPCSHKGGPESPSVWSKLKSHLVQSDITIQISANLERYRYRGDLVISQPECTRS